jgi:hypothetical protein
MEKIILNAAAHGLPDEPCEIEWTSEAGTVDLTARAPSIGVVSIKADDVFAALVKLRLHLESSGRLLLCNAARKDAYPSRMLLEMAGGRRSYLLHKGKQTTKNDLINVFEPATYEQVGTVAEQRIAYEEWLRSLV